MFSLKAFFCKVIVVGLPNIAGAQHINTKVLNAIVEEAKRSNSNALLVYKDNKVIYENYFGYKQEPIEAMSASKSIVSIAIGLLIENGFIAGVVEPVYKLYPEWKQGHKKEITIKHLLNHASGLQNCQMQG